MRHLPLLVLPLLAGCSAGDERQASAAGASMGGDVISNGVGAGAADPVDPVEGDRTRLPPDDRLAGRWIGPEGLTADVTPLGGARYRIAMRYTLDDEGAFEATRVGDALLLQRPDGRVSLSYGAGAQTGLKWADPAARCLIAKVGSEAYCRPAA